ncbi:hypothetical protein D9M68_852770 [compost metagenome]
MQPRLASTDVMHPRQLLVNLSLKLDVPVQLDRCVAALGSRLVHLAGAVEARSLACNDQFDVRLIGHQSH